MKVHEFTVLVLVAAIAAACGGGGTPADGGDGADTAAPCAPSGALDLPDVNGIDADCDGVDGVASDAIFVDGNLGNDTNAGTRTAPVQTIHRGLELASVETKHSVLVASGNYTAGVTLVEGIEIHGSYTSTTWVRVPLAGRTPNTIINAASPVVIGANITMPTRLSGLHVIASDAVVAGQSSIAVRLVDASGVRMEDCILRGGVGADGATGATSSIVPVEGTDGPDGVAGCTDDVTCAANSFTVMPFYTNPPCTCGRGGGGGWAWNDAGNTRVSGVPSQVNASGECVSSVGMNGSTASATGGAGMPGAPGENGGVGDARTRDNAFGAAGYTPVSGNPGGRGRDGGGGGGGASGEPVTCPGSSGPTLRGGTGANGGGGGCGGEGGGGGGGGGLSVALYLWRSTPTLVRVSLLTSAAGDGGAGAAGVVGADGGARGDAPQSVVTCPSPNASIVSNRGGHGGAGGKGGDGGTGAGGTAGISSAIIIGEDSGLSATSSALEYTISDVVASGGTGGMPGHAGLNCNAFRVSDQACLDAP